jgi:hypothetical protein
VSKILSRSSLSDTVAIPNPDVLSAHARKRSVSFETCKVPTLMQVGLTRKTHFRERGPIVYDTSLRIGSTGWDGRSTASDFRVAERLWRASTRPH